MDNDLVRQQAWQAIKEWLAAPNYKEKVRSEDFWAAISLGQEMKRRRQECSFWWRKDAESEQFAALVRHIDDAWMENGWIRFQQARLGRPRTVTYPHSTLAKAHRLYNYGGPRGYKPDSSYRWAESILGERKKYGPLRVIVIADAVYSELLAETGEESLENLTRDQVATLLDLPKTASDRFCRWLLTVKPWQEVKMKRKDGSRATVLRRMKA